MSVIPNPIIKIGFPRSGVESGSLDYNLKIDPLEDLSHARLEDLLWILDNIKDRVHRHCNKG